MLDLHETAAGTPWAIAKCCQDATLTIFFGPGAMSSPSSSLCRTFQMATLYSKWYSRWSGHTAVTIEEAWVEASYADLQTWNDHSCNSWRWIFNICTHVYRVFKAQTAGCTKCPFLLQARKVYIFERWMNRNYASRWHCVRSPQTFSQNTIMRAVNPGGNTSLRPCRTKKTPLFLVMCRLWKQVKTLSTMAEKQPKFPQQTTMPIPFSK